MRLQLVDHGPVRGRVIRPLAEAQRVLGGVDVAVVHAASLHTFVGSTKMSGSVGRTAYSP